jgi:hypothetical protein
MQDAGIEGDEIQDCGAKRYEKQGAGEGGIGAIHAQTYSTRCVFVMGDVVRRR